MATPGGLRVLLFDSTGQQEGEEGFKIITDCHFFKDLESQHSKRGNGHFFTSENQPIFNCEDGYVGFSIFLPYSTCEPN